MRLLEIELENFKSFKGRISIPFGDGFTSITGPNGSGKSTLARCLNGLCLPQAGFVEVDGVRSDDRDARSQLPRQM